MNRCIRFLISCAFMLLLADVSAFAQGREDAIWARSTTETITLDGVLNESSWVQADSIHLIFGQSSGLPTSGWTTEGAANASGNADSAHATLKFLSQNNELYIAFIIPDSSIGGHAWTGVSWDGILMNVKNINTIPPGREEIFPTFLFSDTAAGDSNGRGVGSPPRFGYQGPYREERTPEDVAKWDMGYVVNGITNDDSAPDTGYIFEMRINLDTLGYNTTRTEGDIVGLNISLYDADWFFQPNALKRAGGRVWWQHPWSDQGENSGRVYIRPDVTVNSGPVPEIPPDVIVPNGVNQPDPTIDGDTSDAAWVDAYSFKIIYGDSANIRSYPGLGGNLSGWFEAATAPKPAVLDPANATIKIFFKGDFLYLYADVADQLIQSDDAQDGKDGVRFIIGLRDSVGAEHQMVFLNLLADFDSLGNPKADEDLDTLVKQGIATLGVIRHGSVNNKTDIDTGYTIELKLDLTGFGYPSGLGDGILFGGVDVLDADSFDDPANNYGSRTWFYKENKGGGPTAWMYMDPNTLVGVDDQQAAVIPKTIEIYGNYPNPFNPSTKIKYSIPYSGRVELLVYNVIGQRVTSLVSNQSAGTHEVKFDAGSFSSGVYIYRIKLNAENAQVFQSKVGKMILMK